MIFVILFSILVLSLSVCFTMVSTDQGKARFQVKKVVISLLIGLALIAVTITLIRFDSKASVDNYMDEKVKIVKLYNEALDEGDLEEAEKIKEKINKLNSMLDKRKNAVSSLWVNWLTSSDWLIADPIVVD